MPGADPARAELQAQVDAQQEEIHGLRQQLADARRHPSAAAAPEALEVLRTAQAEYLAGHRSDRAAARDQAVVYTAEDRAEYQRALISHYTAVRALIRSRQKEALEDV